MRDAAHIGDASERRLRRAIVLCCRRLHARGLIAGLEGNVSVRLTDDELLVTPAGVDKARLRSAMIVRVPLALYSEGTLRHDPDYFGDSVFRPSSEIGMHVSCYRARPDVGAIVHTHAPVATGFATAGRPLPDDVLPELIVGVGGIALVPYERPGTSALGTALAGLAAGHDVFLLANHGVTTLGRSLDDALHRMESVEQAARILLTAQLLGGATALPPGEVAALVARRSG